MNEQLKALLLKLGLDTATVQALSDNDADALKDFKADDQIQVIRTATAEALKNDSAFIEPLKKEVRGQLLSSKERKVLKLFDISKEEYDKLPDATKFDSLLELAQQKAAESSGATDDGLKANLKEAKEQILKQADTIKKYEDEIIPGLKNSVSAERDTMILENLVRKQIGKEKLIIEPDFAYASLMGAMRGKYDIVLDESKNTLSLKQKGKDLDVIVDNKKLTFAEALTQEIQTAGIARKSKAPGDGGKGGGQPGDGGDGDGKKPYKFAGSKKAQERAEQLKAKAEGGGEE